MRPGEWQLTDAQAHKLRDYLLRGGFFMADDFWGTPEWDVFWDSMRRVFPIARRWSSKTAQSFTPFTIWTIATRSPARGVCTAVATRTTARGALEGHLRRQGPPDGGHHHELRSRRFVGVGRRAGVSGTLFGARHPHRRELRHLRDDALTGNRKLKSAVKALMTWRARGRLFVCVALSIAVAFAQGEPPRAPSFRPDRVYLFDHPVPLAPDLILSIFGNDLGPSAGCVGEHDAQGIYPKALCDTQVLVGGIPSGLLYVQADQINFQVPPETPIQGTTDLKVVYQRTFQQSRRDAAGSGGRDVVAGWSRASGNARMAEVENAVRSRLRDRLSIHDFPASFGCNEVEVRRNGACYCRDSSDVGKQAFNGITMQGNPCGSIVHG